MYQHHLINRAADPIERKTLTQKGKIVCIGRNYADHAVELGNEVPAEPLFFIKPSSAIVELDAGIALTPQLSDYLKAQDSTNDLSELHYEAELALLIDKPLDAQSTAEECLAAISGIGLGLDLTLRQLQSQLKAKQLPWEKAKSFDGSCLLSDFVAIDQFSDLTQLRYSLAIDGELRQQGDSSLMLFPIAKLLPAICRWFNLQPGDVILTGTPKGVGVLQSSQQLSLSLATDSGELSATTHVR